LRQTERLTRIGDVTGRPRANNHGRMSISVVLSTVSDEFRAYRDLLRGDLS
jgi:hypothetical protein